MRQFNYKYKSYLKNRHGFVNMVPDAKLLHDYMGISGKYGMPVFQTPGAKFYGELFCDIFKDNKRTFQHKVKMFFPEIKHGVISIDKIQYSMESDPVDDVSMEYRLIQNGKYEEYYVIDDFVVEFEIEVSVSFGKRNSITKPVEIFCDYIDVYVHNQLISLTVHDNNILFVPYAMSYRLDMPPEAARNETDSSNMTVNTDLSYGFILNKASRDKMEEKGFKTTEMDMLLLDSKKKIQGLKEDVVDNPMDTGIPGPLVAKRHSGVSKKYMISLPESIFPDRMTYSGLPIFNSENCLSCCDVKKLGWCSVHFKPYGLPMSSPCPPPAPPCGEKCSKFTRYTVRNRLIDTLLILMDKTFEELDSLVVKHSSRAATELIDDEYIVEKE